MVQLVSTPPSSNLTTRIGGGGGGLLKQAVFKTLKMVHKFAFSRMSMKVHEISENDAIGGGEKENICGDDPVKTRKCEIVYPL